MRVVVESNLEMLELREYSHLSHPHREPGIGSLWTENGPGLIETSLISFERSALVVPIRPQDHELASSTYGSGYGWEPTLPQGAPLAQNSKNVVTLRPKAR